MEKLKYKKITEFINTLNYREKKYTLNKIQQEIYKNKILTTNFTINGKPI